jgi:hypothetical protein
MYKVELSHVCTFLPPLEKLAIVKSDLGRKYNRPPPNGQPRALW